MLIISRSVLLLLSYHHRYGNHLTFKNLLMNTDGFPFYAQISPLLIRREFQIYSIFASFSYGFIHKIHPPLVTDWSGRILYGTF